jgi:hypothetical protein
VADPGGGSKPLTLNSLQLFNEENLP